MRDKLMVRCSDLARFRKAKPRVQAHDIPEWYADGCEDTRELIAADLEREADGMYENGFANTAKELRHMARRVLEGRYLP